MTDPNQQPNKPAFPGFSTNSNFFSASNSGLNPNNNNQTTNTSGAQNNPTNGNKSFPNNSNINFSGTFGSSNVPNTGTDSNKNQGATSSFPSNPFNDTANSTSNNLGLKPNTGIGDTNVQKTSNPFGGGDTKNFGFISTAQNNPLQSNNQANPSEQNIPNKTLFGGGMNSNSAFGGINSDKTSFPQPNTTNSSASVLTFNPNSNGLDANKTTNPLNLAGNLSSANNLSKGFSFGNNQNLNSIPGNTANTDKPADQTNATASNLQTNPVNNVFSNLMARPTANPTKPEETGSAQATSSLFTKQDQTKATDASKTGLFSLPKEGNPLKSPFSLNADKGNSNNQNSLFSTSNEPTTNPVTNPGENKPSIGIFSKTEPNLTANTGSIDSNLGAKINIGFGAKQEVTAPNTDKVNETANFFTKEKKGSSTDAQAQNKPGFSLNKKQETAENIQANTSKPVSSQNPSELFTSKSTIEAAKIDKKQDRKETEKKEESNNISLIINIVKLSDPKEIKISNSLEEVAINAMMKKSIEEVINHWKNELDNQVDRFDSSAEKLKNFEFMFRKHFETIVSLYELINNLKEDGNNTLRNLKDIALEEDQIIEQLNIMEKSLDQYLEIADSRQSQMGRGQVDGRDQIYSTATEIAKTVDDIQKDIDDVNSKISDRNVVNKEENLHVMNYENTNLKESISMDKNEFTNILNSYYSSLRSIQFMEQNLTTKIMQADVELNDIRREREREKY